MRFDWREYLLLMQFLSYRDENTFLRLYHLHTNAVFHVALQLAAGNATMAGDIFHNAWLAAIENLSSLPAKTRFRGWLIAQIVLYSRAEYQKKKYHLLIHDSTPEKRSKITNLKNVTTCKNLEHALGRLPVGYRHVFILHDMYGYGYNDISKLLGISEGTCMLMLFNARREVQESWEKNLPPDANAFREWVNKELQSVKAAYSKVRPSFKLKDTLVTQLLHQGLIQGQIPKRSFIKSSRNALMRIMWSNTGFE